jgi:hypothetical protein
VSTGEFCIIRVFVCVPSRFTSLGTVGGLRLVNNDTLVLHSTMGSYCKGFGHYKTVVNFECSQKRVRVVTRNYNFEKLLF